MVKNKKMRQLIQEVVEQIKKGYDPEKIILFGSYAYGRPTPDSDIDLFIVKDTDKRRVDRFVDVRRLIYQPGWRISISPLVYTPEEVGETAGLSPAEIAARFYPSFYDGALVRKFVVPIQPKYHDRLFTDYLGRQAALTEPHEFIPEGNTISKAYICHTATKTMQPADIVLLYLSRSSKLTYLGIVEEVHRGSLDADSVLRLVAKRTVYNRDELEEITRKPTTVILFRQHLRLRPLSLSVMKEMGVLKGPPQSIQQIDDQKYRGMKERAGLDARFTVS